MEVFWEENKQFLTFNYFCKIALPDIWQGLKYTFVGDY